MRRPSRGNDRRSAGRSANSKGSGRNNQGSGRGSSSRSDGSYSKKRDDDKGEKRSYGRSSEGGERKYEKRSDDRPYKKRDDDRGEKRSYGRSSEGGERKYEKRSGDRPYKKRDDDKGEKRSYGRSSEGGERKYEKRSGDRPYKKRDNDRGEKRSYGRSSEGGERKYEKRSEDRPYKRRSEEHSDGPERKKSFAESSARPAPRPRIKKDYIDEDFKDDDQFDFNLLNKEKKNKQRSAKEYGKVLKDSKKKPKTEKRVDDGSIRLNKFIANTGVCSRREADELIESGVIKVNGQIVTELGTRVQPTDRVHYGDQLLTREQHVYVLLNKPKDYITTSDDPEKRRTVMELVDNATKERIYPVGRLDRNTTGLLLFTNDGELTDKLTHPRNNIKKIYHVMTDQNVKKEDIQKLKEGFELEDGFIKVDDVQFVGDASNKRDLGVEIHSGRNRIVRRMFEQLGYKVIKLDRVMFAGLVKKDLPRGKWRFLTPKEVSFLKML